jgi:chromosome segregation ATPase
MGQDPGQGQPQLSGDQKPADELRAEIEEVREDLGDTAAAIAAKTDVKTRAREKADELKRSVTTKKQELLSKTGRSPSAADGSNGTTATLTQVKTKADQNPVIVAAAGALIGGFVLGRLTRREP